MTKSKGIVGLDLEAGSVAATEVHGNGSTRISNGGVVSLPSGLVREGEVTDTDQLADALKELFSRYKLGKSVRLGVANQRVVVRMMRFPALEKREELETAIRFQAQDHIPMPLEQAVLDYQVIGGSNGEGGEATVDVLVVAARREMISPLVQAMRKAGLRPLGIDLSAFAMIRALADEAPSGGSAEVPSYEERIASGTPIEDTRAATLYCNLGDITNLAVARGSTCLFTRVSQFGVEGIAQRLAERRGLTVDHAREWLSHVGLETPVEEIEGDPETITATRDVLAEGASKLVDELRLSLEYYGAHAREEAVAIETIVACGSGTTVPGLTTRIERGLGMRVLAPQPEALAHLDPAAAARLTVAYGLGLGS